jgi:hypothetical protein
MARFWPAYCRVKIKDRCPTQLNGPFVFVWEEKPAGDPAHASFSEEEEDDSCLMVRG